MRSRDRTFPAAPAKQQGLEASLAPPPFPPTQTFGRGLLPSGPPGIFAMPTLLLPHCCFHMGGGGLPAHSRDPPHSSPLSP